MPTIQSKAWRREDKNGNIEFGADSVIAGLPTRWGEIAYAELQSALKEAGPKSERYTDLARLLDEVTAAPIPLDATDAHLCVLAERYANDCATHGAFITEPAALRARLASICKIAGIEAPDCDDDAQAIMRCNDPLWWRGRLRKVHGRAFEAAAIRLGMVSTQKAKYCSDETVMRRLAQNKRNAQGLASVKMLNVETGQEMTLAALAERGTGNPKLRRGEMMMRLAGCDKIAKSLGHLGLFVTVTAPRAYHAVIHKTGKPNPNFNGATPVETHRYLCNVWTLTRAKNDRDGIAPYGFRVAEPHHDGCTHWHMLVFMPPEHIPLFVANLSAYALAEDGHEPGAQESRVKFEQMDPAKGGAAAYMAKYVSKNIGDGPPSNDVFGKPIITTPMRVDAWAGCWGIRQFQPFGQPPVTVYREFRRMEEKQVAGADVPDHIKLAYAACQRIESKTEKDADGKPIVLHRADWSEYVIAQGGVKVGKVKTKTRDYSAAEVVPYSSKGKNKGKFRFVGIKTRTKIRPLMSQGRVGGFVIALYAPLASRPGRYGLTVAPRPAGVFCREENDVVYKSTRYTWKQTGREADRTFKPKGAAVGAGFDVPWSPVNNCTEPARRGSAPAWASEVLPGEPVAEFAEDWWDSDEYHRIVVDMTTAADHWEENLLAADKQRAKTVWTVPSYAQRRGAHANRTR